MTRARSHSQIIDQPRFPNLCRHQQPDRAVLALGALVGLFLTRPKARLFYA
jgi:hypothetical protein